jgi:hypothetical protein
MFWAKVNHLQAGKTVEDYAKRIRFSDTFIHHYCNIKDISSIFNNLKTIPTLKEKIIAKELCYEIPIQ